jgi:multidrug resistance protein MdtO
VSAATQWSGGRPSLIGFLRHELAPFPGRFNPVLRTLVSCALVIVISMTLQIPFLALSLIMVFFITQANAAVTRMVGMMFVIGIPLSTAIGALLLKYTFGYPLIRIVAASAIFCTCMFFLRVSRFSLAFFVLGFVTIYVQSLVDLIPDPEALLRTNLWVGAATLYAVVITLLVNTFFLPIEPAAQLNAVMQTQLGRVSRQLQSTAVISPEEVEKAVLGLHKLFKFSSMRDTDYVHFGAYYQACITAVCRLLIAAANLPLDARVSRLEQAVMQDNLNTLSRVIADRQTFLPQRLDELSTGAPALFEMRLALLDLSRTQAVADPDRKPAKEPFMVADAMTNPKYLKFVLKTFFATLLCYVFYNGVDWPGIHTIMLTSVITSLPNLGASSQKGVLRVGGCLIGAALSVFAMVFVVPHLETIFGLLLMSLSVVALFAWICAGSDKISYAGTQIIFCFALALLEDFGPVYDLTIIRDRLIGIVLGVVITTAIQTFIWPEREGGVLIKKLAVLVQNIASLLTPAASNTSPLMTLSCWNQVADCEAMSVRVQFEPGAARNVKTLPHLTNELLLRSRRLILIVHEIAAARALMLDDSEPVVDALLDKAMGCLLFYAEQLDSTQPVDSQSFYVLIRDLRAQLIELQTTAHAVNEQLVLGGIEKLIVELENLPALEH